MPTPESIYIVHPNVAGAPLMPLQAAAVLIASYGWQLQNSGDAQYLIPTPADPNPNVITSDELAAALAALSDSYAPLAQTTGWRDITPEDFVPGPQRLLLRRIDGEVEFVMRYCDDLPSSVFDLPATGWTPSLGTSVSEAIRADDNSIEDGAANFVQIALNEGLQLRILSGAGYGSCRIKYSCDQEFPDQADWPGVPSTLTA